DSARLCRIGEHVEPRCRHLRTARVVNAGEQHRDHGEPSDGMRSTTRSAVDGSTGTSQRKTSVARAAPASCAKMKLGTSAGRMPAKVSVAARARVTAGLANEVDAVNQ